MKPQETEIDVYISLAEEDTKVGTLAFSPGRRSPVPRFEYAGSWLSHPNAFSIDPEAPLGQGAFHPANGVSFRAIYDSAPDSWGRKLMQRRERRRADTAGEAPGTLFDHDYLMAVADFHRLGALRFQYSGGHSFEACLSLGIPTFKNLRELMVSADRIERGEETDDDIAMLFHQGSSLGGARPKASVQDEAGNLYIAKFPKETDSYSIERWEFVALTLAERAGMNVAKHRLVELAGRQTLLSRRFDRNGRVRIPFMSAMARLQAVDGEEGSYLDLLDNLVYEGANPKADREELFRRVAFSILISNVDDHLRNHGFLYAGNGWQLSPLYDVNPVPIDLKPRILSTRIDFDSATCSIPLLLETCESYGLSRSSAAALVKKIGGVTAHWRQVAEQFGAPRHEIDRMSSAFEHEDSDRAAKL